MGEEKARADLPACFYHTWDIAAHNRLAQLVSAKTELAVDAMRTPGGPATPPLTNRAGIPRQLLQRQDREVNLFRRRVPISNPCLDLRTLRGILRDYRGTLEIAVDHAFLSHSLVFSSGRET